MSAVIVRYRVKAGRAEENAELVRAVYAQLAERSPPPSATPPSCSRTG